MTEFEVFKICLSILLIIGWCYIIFQVWRIDKLENQLKNYKERIFDLEDKVAFLHYLQTGDFRFNDDKS